jgi:dolichol-phosphate mannosyltransferase
MPPALPQFSIVIPARNEAANIARLIDEIAAVCAPLGSYEIVVVDDASEDGMRAVLDKKLGEGLPLTVLRHDRPGGQSAALHSGVTAARGGVICTLDGDGQNPPAELPKLLAPFAADAEETLGLVAGQRLNRQDTWTKKAASRFANRLRGALLRDGTRDTGCGLKAFRRKAYLGLPFFRNMHRYLPALFLRDGWRIMHVDVAHAERWGGQSHYTNIDRALEGLFDLAGVAWLIRRRKSCRVESQTRAAEAEDRTWMS